MNIDKTAFCNLSNSLKWQTWLANYDKDMHSWFMNRLRANRGCSDNRKLMDEVLDNISSSPEGETSVLSFIELNFPFMILDRTGFNRVIISELIEYFSSPIMTFPHRRLISTANQHDDTQDNSAAVEFCADKYRCDYLSVDGYVFVEFLYRDEMSYLDEIPSKSWLLSKYKNSRRITNGE